MIQPPDPFPIPDQLNPVNTSMKDKVEVEQKMIFI